MSYRIDYEPSPKYERRKSDSSRKTAAMTAGFLALFLMLTHLFWPEGRTMLRRVFIPGDDEVTTAAFCDLVEQVQSGEPVIEAVNAFCREILTNAEAAR